ncbi:hypothetical protein B0H16DRAFT_1795857 [Mycena metata]|uniref:Uncharacterized protein n=1 Tax=Mycena metata TaxID=1033252 RepID=A0AAD7HF93_9AGAR|nr:hypothetical protein B0H16DRAFT_1795857 [Mycena metata]
MTPTPKLSTFSWKPAGFFVAAVKALNVWGLNDTETVKVLAACPGVPILSYQNLNVFVPQLTQLPLRRLTAPTRVSAYCINSTIAPAWLPTLTHLDIGFSNPQGVPLAAMLRRLPRLTNLALALTSSVEPSFTAEICASCPVLRVLVLFTTRAEDGEYQKQYAFDSRIVLVNAASDDDEDWNASLLGLPDFWTRAESVVDGRRGQATIQSI